MAAKGIQFPRRWYGGMISANLEVIWVMSDESVYRPAGGDFEAGFRAGSSRFKEIFG